ncbi:hypothetical protein [Nakamurella aerolata]|nr:hypothetical protein [Nakamurella aerolata]
MAGIDDRHPNADIQVVIAVYLGAESRYWGAEPGERADRPD